jgi:hypothetical protein
VARDRLRLRFLDDAAPEQVAVVRRQRVDLVPFGIECEGDDGRRPGNVAVLVRVSATRPDGRAFDNPQILLFKVEGDRVRSVDQFVGDPSAVKAFWA